MWRFEYLVYIMRGYPLDGMDRPIFFPLSPVPNNQGCNADLPCYKKTVHKIIRELRLNFRGNVHQPSGQRRGNSPMVAPFQSRYEPRQPEKPIQKAPLVHQKINSFYD